MRKLAILFLLVTISLFADDQRPYATCWIAGQMGNNMCQIAATLAYAWDNGLEARFPELHQEKWNIAFNRDHFFFRLNHSPLLRQPRANYSENRWWIYDPIPPGEQDIYLKGIFFHIQRFHHHLDKLRNVFAPSKQLKKKLEEQYKWLIKHPKTCSVHVRTYGKDAVENHGCIFLGLDYYREAMALFPKDTLFVFFSDRIQWCKHAFAHFPYNMMFIEGNHIEDFHLMTMMQNHIIANSEFSWWASYLDSKPNKKIVAPRQWYRNRIGILPPEPETILFPEWTVLNVEVNQPYPDDMCDYDAFSTSTDTQ